MDKIKADKKKILIIGINFLPELTGIGKYTGEMVSFLAENGFDCRVISAFPYYPQWKVQKPYKNLFYKTEKLSNEKIKVLRCPLYVPKKLSGARRILHEASFFLTAFLAVCYYLFQPRQDYIFCVAPPFHLGFLALFYRSFRGGKIIYHIHDLQVDAARDLGMIKSRPLLTAMFAAERHILAKADEVSSISPGMIARISRKTEKKILFFPNWVDTDRFFPVPDRIALKRRFGFAPDERIVLYSGSIGEKQGLEVILKVAKEMEKERGVKFLICGTGPYKRHLERSAQEQMLQNLMFYPLQPAETFNDFFNIADVHLVIQKANAGDLVMPSKLTTILAVGGLAVVTSNPGSTLYDEVSCHKLGILSPAEDPQALFDSIKSALEQENNDFRRNARIYAETRLSSKRVLDGVLIPLVN